MFPPPAGWQNKRLTSSPPGRLTADNRRTESSRELVSTFHRFCCTCRHVKDNKYNFISLKSNHKPKSFLLQWFFQLPHLQPRHWICKSITHQQHSENTTTAKATVQKQSLNSHTWSLEVWHRLTCLLSPPLQPLKQSVCLRQHRCHGP